MLKAAELYKTIIDYWRKNKDKIPWEDSDPSWTKWIKDSFYEIGKSKYKVERSKSNHCGEGEYLVDLCWWKEQGNDWWLELALESEWGQGEDEIDHDFCKLIDIKAYLKVWVCSYGDKIIEARKRKMFQNIAGGKIKFPEEQYLVINLPDSQKAEYKNQLRVFAYEIDYMGKDSLLTPQPDIINR